MPSECGCEERDGAWIFCWLRAEATLQPRQSSSCLSGFCVKKCVRDSFHRTQCMLKIMARGKGAGKFAAKREAGSKSRFSGVSKPSAGGKGAGEGFQRGSGFSFNKNIGQHILKNPQIVDAIIERAGIKPTDIVLEVGPGTGNLTTKLLQYAKKVIAVELDVRMVCELQKRFQGSPYAHKLKIIHGDFLKIELPYFDLCVANTPYQISSALVFKLLAHRPQFRAAVLMFQQEFALRMCASASSDLYCRLAVNTQLLSDVSHCFKIGRNNFRPPPKVDSSVIRMEPKNPAPPIDFLEWDGLIRLVFSRKNRTLAALFKQKHFLTLLESNLRTYCALNSIPVDVNLDMKELVVGILDSIGFGQKRSSKLEQEDFLILLDEFHKRNIHFT